MISITHVESPMKYTKRLSRIDGFSKVTGRKVNNEKQLHFLKLAMNN